MVLLALSLCQEDGPLLDFGLKLPSLPSYHYSRYPKAYSNDLNIVDMGPTWLTVTFFWFVRAYSYGTVGYIVINIRLTS